MDKMQYSPVLHRMSQLTVAATLLLIFMGGLVTSHGAGMSVPDWPNSYGYNMFTFPISLWRGGIFFEHTHRLMGTVVGFLSVLMVLNAYGTGQRASVRRNLWIAAAILGFVALCCVLQSRFTEGAARNMLTQSAVGLAGIVLVLGCATLMRRAEPRLWVRRLMVGILAAVIFQGILGGLRVVWVKLDLAIVHACFAQAFLCMTALAAVVTSRWWLETPRPSLRRSSGLIRIAVVCVAVIYLQLIVGAMMRHYHAGLAIPDLPLHYGKLIPPTDEASLATANQARVEMHLFPVSLAQIWLHFGHRAGAIIVSALLVWLVVNVLRSESEPKLRRPAVALIVLLVVQLTLGVLTVLMRKPADIASTHVAVGALTLMTNVVLLIRAMRLYSPMWRTASQRVDVPLAPDGSVVPV